MKRLIVTLLFIIAAIAASAGIVSQYDVPQPSEQFPFVGHTEGAVRTN